MKQVKISSMVYVKPLCGIVSSPPWHSFPSITDRPLLWWRGSLPNACTLQQLYLHSASVFPLPVCMWTGQQQPHRCSTERHLCGKRPFRFGDILLFVLRWLEILILTICWFLQPSIADILSLAWWTSTLAWWDFVYQKSNSMWGAPKTILTVSRLLHMKASWFPVHVSLSAAALCSTIFSSMIL